MTQPVVVNLHFRWLNSNSCIYFLSVLYLLHKPQVITDRGCLKPRLNYPCRWPPWFRPLICDNFTDFLL